VDGQYKFIFYSCIIYKEKTFGIVIDVYMWCGVVRELESWVTHNVQCYFYFSHSLKFWGHKTL